MEFTYLWISLYCLSLVLVINLTNLTSHAFSKKNMVIDPITCRAHYEVPDPGMFPLNYERQGLRSGTFLSFYSVILIFAFVGFDHISVHICKSLVAGYYSILYCECYQQHILKEFAVAITFVKVLYYSDTYSHSVDSFIYSTDSLIQQDKRSPFIRTVSFVSK